MTGTPDRFYHVSQTQLSVARLYGGCKVNGAFYRSCGVCRHRQPEESVMPYEIPTTPAGLRSERAAATRRGMTPEDYRARRASGWQFCPMCDEWLVESDFHSDKTRASGLRKICKECASRARRATPKERRERAEIKAAKRSALAAAREARHREYLRRQALAAEQYEEPQRITDRPPALPYAFRAHNNRGTLSEALRIDTGGKV